MRWLERLLCPRSVDDRESAIAAAIGKVMAAEGGFSDHAADRGGATRYGVTAGVLADWRGCAVSRADVANLPLEEARRIYRVRYFDAANVGLLPEGLWHDALDAVINHGVRGGSKLVQRAANACGAGIAVDGHIGGRTARAISGLGEARYANALVETRLSFYESLARSDSTQAAFLAGWRNRVNKLRRRI